MSTRIFRYLVAFIVLLSVGLFANNASVSALEKAGAKISAGPLHTLYVKNGELYAWGDNTFGQLGDGTRISRLLPVKIPFEKGDIAAVAAGMGFSQVLTADGSLWAFGMTDPESNAFNPAYVKVLDSVEAIAAGYDFSLALKADGSVWAWGNNQSGQLGTGTAQKHLTFTPVKNLPGITQISAGKDHALALSRDGQVWAWGNNSFGQLGMGNDNNSNVPRLLSGLSKIKQIAAGYQYSLALDITGQAFAWGKNDAGQLGISKHSSQAQSIPCALDYPVQFQRVYAGSTNSFALTGGVLYAWGDNRTFLLDPREDSEYFLDHPVEMPIKDCVDVAAGDNRVFVIKATEILAHGTNYCGQLGDGTMHYSYIFLPVLLDQDKVAAHRLGGANRLATAAAIANSGWPDGLTTSVVLARADSFADALAGAPLAAATAAPILLTDSQKLSRETATEIKRLNPQRIFLLGGEGAISKNIASELQADGYEVIRLGGSDRFATSVEIAKYLYAYRMIDGEKAVLCSGLNYPDALSVSPAAGYQRMPILLTSPQELPGSVQSALQELGVKKTFVIGGTGVVSAEIELELPNPVRYGGSDRYETSLLVAKKMQMDSGTVFFASGKNFPDALAGSPYAAWTNSPIILVGDNPPVLTKYQEVLTKPIRNVFVLGGESVISDNLLFKMENNHFPKIAVYYEV